MKLKAIGTVQYVGKGGKVVEAKPGEIFNVSNDDAARLVDARHAEEVGKGEDAAAAASAKAPAATGDDTSAGTEAGNKDAPAL